MLTVWTGGKVKRITMMQLRSEPGEYFHLVYKHGETIIITKAGREIAQICPIDTMVITSNGRSHGEMPITYKRPELIKEEK